MRLHAILDFISTTPEDEGEEKGEGEEEEEDGEWIEAEIFYVHFVVLGPVPKGTAAIALWQYPSLKLSARDNNKTLAMSFGLDYVWLLYSDVVLKFS